MEPEFRSLLNNTTFLDALEPEPAVEMNRTCIPMVIPRVILFVRCYYHSDVPYMESSNVRDQ